MPKSLSPTVVFLTLLLIAGTRAHSCTVFFVFDGKLALAGSNEDWADPNTQMWFVPPTKDNYGVVYLAMKMADLFEQ